MRHRASDEAQAQRRIAIAVHQETRMRYLEKAVALLGAPGRTPGEHDVGTEDSHYASQCEPGWPCWEGAK